MQRSRRNAPSLTCPLPYTAACSSTAASAGSASGDDSLCSRLSDYARTGDGGITSLRHRPAPATGPAILQNTDPGLPATASRKSRTGGNKKPMTCEHGLSRS
jgi:hypothetical protein